MLELMTQVTLVILSLALVLGFVRLILGPTLPDRIVAMDLIGVVTAGIIVVSAAATAERVFLDAAMVIALLAFVGTVAYARYVERGYGR